MGVEQDLGEIQECAETFREKESWAIRDLPWIITPWSRRIYPSVARIFQNLQFSLWYTTLANGRIQTI